MTTDERLENLERELARAKRINRWVLAAVGLALGVWTLAVALGPSPAGAQGGAAAMNEVRAMKFVLVDAAGKVKALLGVTDAGPALCLNDAAGKIRTVLGLDAKGPMLCLNDAAGIVRAELNVQEDGPRLFLYNEGGKRRAAVSALGGVAAMGLCDAAGMPNALLCILKDEPQLHFSYKGTDRMVLGVNENGAGLTLFGDNGQKRSVLAEGVVGMIDADGTTRASLGVTADGPALCLNDAAGKGRTMLNVNAAGPRLFLYDAASKTRAALTVNADGGPTLFLFDAAGKGRAILGTEKLVMPDGKTITYPESSLLLFGPDGRVLWQTP